MVGAATVLRIVYVVDERPKEAHGDCADSDVANRARDLTHLLRVERYDRLAAAVHPLVYFEDQLARHDRGRVSACAVVAGRGAHSGPRTFRTLHEQRVAESARGEERGPLAVALD